MDWNKYVITAIPKGTYCSVDCKFYIVDSEGDDYCGLQVGGKRGFNTFQFIDGKKANCDNCKRSLRDCSICETKIIKQCRENQDPHKI